MDMHLLVLEPKDSAKEQLTTISRKKNSKTATPKDLEFNEIYTYLILMIKNVCQGCHFRIADLHY